jgi:MFS family permease
LVGPVAIGGSSDGQLRGVLLSDSAGSSPSPSPETTGGASQRRLFYGWVMLPVATLGLICSAPGQSFGVQPFKELLGQSLELSRSQVSTAYMAGTLLAALPMTYVGWCMDRFGARRTLMVIVTLLGIACLLISQAAGLFTLFLGFLLLRTFGQGSLTLLNFNTMAMWFHHRLGFVNALMSMGLAGAVALVPSINLTLIDQFGWRWAYALLGLGVWAIMFPLLLFVFRNKPEDVNQRPDNEPHPHPDEPVAADMSLTLKQAMRCRAYWILLAMVAFWALANTGLIICLASLFETRGMATGLAQSQAAQVMLAYGTMMFVMHLPAGYLVDRVPANRLLVVSALCMAGLFVLVQTVRGGSALVYVIGACQGLAQSLLMAVNATLWVRFFGRAQLGRIRGTVTTTMVAGSAVGPLLLDGTYDLTGSYAPMLLVFAAAPAALAVASAFATPPAAAEAPPAEPAPDADEDDEPWDESEPAVTDSVF